VPGSPRHGRSVSDVQRPATSPSLLLHAVRYGIPIVLVIAGFVVLLVDNGWRRYDGFALLVGAGLSVALLNVLFRIGASGDRERADEERAREFLSEHGYWPDEAPAQENHEAADRGTR
jgi:hypothetical protein